MIVRAGVHLGYVRDVSTDETFDFVDFLKMVTGQLGIACEIGWID